MDYLTTYLTCNTIYTLTKAIRIRISYIAPIMYRLARTLHILSLTGELLSLISYLLYVILYMISYL